ncbi:phage tail tape measure protein [Streptomyces sp. NPDC020983]|uniref:phage tail tape measure protein n=1 Tax=Streptomyces sp. NPDC020983 TaxID=3365106 RepID=UPI0037B8B232
MAIRTSGVRYDLIARDSASRTFSRVGGSASKLERRLGKLAKAGLATGAALAAGVAVGLAEGTKKAVAFEAEMKKIQTQAGASAKDVGTLSKQVLELGKSTQQGPQKLAESLYHLKSVGMDNVEAMTALKTASDLAAVGGSDLEATTNALAGAWRTGIKGADNFGKTAATVNAIIGAGNMRMEDMVAALGTGILPTAKTFGLTFAQVGGALALFTDEGIDSASAATRLRMSISLLAAPSKAAEKQLKKIGLTGNMLGKAMRSKDGIIGAIKLLSEHLGKSGLDATHQAALLSRAFGGGKSSSAILSMVNNLDVLEKKQVQINSSMGKYGPAVEAQRKTAAAQLKIIRSNLEVFAIKTGNVLLPPLTGFVTYITKTALPAVDRFGHELVTKFVPVDQIKSSFTTASGLVSDFFDGLTPKKAPRMPSPQIKAPTIPSMIARPKPQKSEARQFGEQLRKLISGGIGDAVKGVDWGKLGRQIGAGLATAIGWVGQHLSDLTTRVIKALGKLDYVKIGKSFGKMAIPLSIGFVRSLFDPLFTADFWRKHWLDTIVAVVSLVPVGRIGGALAKVFEKIPVLKMFAPLLKSLGGLGKLVEKPLGGILKGVGAVVRGVGRGFVLGFERVFPEASRTLLAKLDELVLKVFGYGARAGAAGIRFVQGLGNGIVRGGVYVGTAIGRLAGNLVKPFMRSGTWLVAAGAALVNGLLHGVGTSLLGVGKWLYSHMVSPIVGAVKSLFGIHSPSTVFASIGGDLVRGLLSGISSAVAGIGKWLYGHLVSPIKGAFDGAGDWLYGKGKDVMSGLLSGLRAGFKGVKDFLGTVKRATTGSSGGSAGALGGKVAGFASGGVARPGTLAWVGEKGPELMRVGSTGTRIYNHADSMALAGTTGTKLPGYASGTSKSSTIARDLAAAVRGALSNGFLKALETGTASGVASAIKSMNTKLQHAGAGGLVAGNLRTSTRMQGLANRRASIAAQITQARQAVTDQAQSLADLLSVTDTSATSISGLIAQMRQGQAGASAFAKETASLSKRGLNKTLLTQLADAGPGSQLAKILSGASSSDIKALNKLAASQSALTTSFGKTMADAMYDSGAQAGKGFLSGLQAQEKALQAEMNRLAAGMVSTIKRRLGIHSPSRVMHEQVGKQTALGVVSGMRAYTPHVEREAQRMADTAAAVRARNVAGGLPAGGGSAVVVQPVIHIHTDDPRLRDLIRVEIEPVVQASEARTRARETRSAFRAKVGTS